MVIKMNFLEKWMCMRTIMWFLYGDPRLSASEVGKNNLLKYVKHLDRIQLIEENLFKRGSKNG